MRWLRYNRAQSSDGARIALIVTEFPSMSETFILNKVVGLAESGYQVLVISHKRSNGSEAYRDRLKSLSVRHCCLTDLSGIVFGLAALFRVLFCNPALGCHWMAWIVTGRRRKPLSRVFLLGSLIAHQSQIVHFEFSGLAIAYLSLIDLLRNAKIFVSCRGTAEKVKALVDPVRAANLKELFELVDRVHCVSQDMLDVCLRYGLPAHKAFVNRPAIRIENFTRAVRVDADDGCLRPIRICATGRLHWIKGFEFAVLAVKILKESGCSVQLEIIGEGPEREKLAYLVQTLGLSEQVTLAGRLNGAQVRSHLESCDVFLLPSLSEGISNAALEAMAMELPVISTCAGGMNEVITAGRNGILVDCCSSQDLANAIERLIRTPGLRRQLGENARETILSEFGLERQIARFAREYGAACQAER